MTAFEGRCLTIEMKPRLSDISENRADDTNGHATSYIGSANKLNEDTHSVQHTMDMENRSTMLNTVVLSNSKIRLCFKELCSDATYSEGFDGEGNNPTRCELCSPSTTEDKTRG